MGSTKTEFHSDPASNIPMVSMGRLGGYENPSTFAINPPLLKTEEGYGSTNSDTARALKLLEWISAWGVTIIGQDKIVGFLINNPDIYGPLLFVCDKAIKGLPPGTKFFASLETDPEYPKRQLVLIARRNSYGDEFANEIQIVRNELRSELKGKKGKVFLTTDFQSLEDGI